MDAKEILRLCSDSGEIKEFRKYCERFADAMLTKFVDKLMDGWVGWDEEEFTIEHIKQAIREHLKGDDPIDIANFALFWFIKQQKKEKLNSLKKKEEKNEL